MNDVPLPPSSDDELLDRLVEQFTGELRAGACPSIDDYVQRYPGQTELRELLASAAMIEELKSGSSGPASTVNRTTPRPLVIERLGDYRIIQELGRGGMGVVLLGVHESLGRRVAIKVMPSHLADDESYVERFRREAQAAATLHHTNIVSVFGVGRSEGHHYYVMEYIDGEGLNRIIRSLRAGREALKDVTMDVTKLAATAGGQPKSRPTMPAEAKTLVSHGDEQEFDCGEAAPESTVVFRELADGPARFRRAAEICEQIADALDYAHRQGKLHRDIKPSNLLLDRTGRVWLTDFGLVKSVSGQTVTSAGEIVGTPQYMAPESLAGKYDVRSEVCCLGLTLYELLALQPAWSSDNTPELIRRITNEAPRPLRRIDASIPRDLATIVEKAIAREPAGRYATVAELRDDLRAWLDGRPISARRTAIHRRVWLWSRRNPWAALSAVLTGLVALSATIGWMLVSSAYRELESQHELLASQQQQTRAARLQAELNADNFREQYLRAEANVQLTLQMFDEMFRRMVMRGNGDDAGFAFDGFQELVGIQTTVTAADARFLEDMLVFFEHFAEANAGNRELQQESARALRRVANIYHLTGKYDQAVEAYQRATDLYAMLYRQQPDSAEWLSNRARTGNEMALALARSSKYREAMGVLRDTRVMLEKNAHSDDAEVQLELARTLNLTGSLLPVETVTREPEALAELLPANLRGVLRQRRRLIDRRETTPAEIARNQRAIGEAIDVLEKLVYGQGNDQRYRLERAKSHARLSELQFHSDQLAESDKSRSAAIADLELLMIESPENVEYASVLAQVLSLPGSGADDQRVAELQRAANVTEDLLDRLPRNLDLAQLDSDINWQLGQLLFESDSIDAAAAAWARTLEMLRRVVEDTPGNRDAWIRSVAITLELAEQLLEHQRYREARDLLRLATARMQRQVRAERGLQPARLVLARYYQLLAEALTGLGDERGASQAQRQASQFEAPRRDAR